MKKLDKLFLHLFLRYFVLILPVIVFLLLIQYLLKYFDDFVGKGVDFFVFVQLIFYFSINMVPMALNLSVMIAALMTYGTLGEHSELTAIKSSGIFSLRLLRIVFIFVLCLSISSFYANAYLIPHVNLKAFLLLHDIQQKKPAFNLQEKQFYSDIPGYSIRVDKKLLNNGLQGVMIYDHREKQRRTQQRIIMADSGHIYNTTEDLLRIALFNGNYYIETRQKDKESIWQDLLRSHFSRLEMSFSLSSFQLKRSAEEYFSHLRYGKQINDLFTERDSMQVRMDSLFRKMARDIPTLYLLQDRYTGPTLNLPPSLDSLSPPQAAPGATFQTAPAPKLYLSRSDSTVIQHRQETVPPSSLPTTDAFLRLWNKPFTATAIDEAIHQTKYINSNLTYRNENLKETQKELYLHELEAYKRYALAFSCVVMFLIGASIGGIIKKGGLGVPLLIATSFFIVFHVITILTEKYAREGLMPTWMASSTSGIVLSICAGLLLILLAKDVPSPTKASLHTFFTNISASFRRS